MKSMKSIKTLIENNPDLLRCGSVDLDKKKRIHKYSRIIEDSYDKLEDIAGEYRSWVVKIPVWRPETGERVFHFGKEIAEEYDLNLNEVRKLFNEVLPQGMRGAMLGFFVSGTYHTLIRKADTLLLDLTKYRCAVSGLGYRHPRGKLEIAGNRAYYLGLNMRDGKILLKGYAGSHVGTWMGGGRIVIEGNVGNWVGWHLSGGVIRIKGNAKDIIGKKMTGGEIIVEGNAGGWVGDGMIDGVIRIQGKCGSWDAERSGGQIFRWQEGWKRIEPK